MSKFKVGDRVAVYGSGTIFRMNGWREAGLVIGQNETFEHGTRKSLGMGYEVRLDDGAICFYHEKQCRKLVKKKNKNSTSQLEPFNLERALKGDAVITRNGCKVRLKNGYQVEKDWVYRLGGGIIDEEGNTVSARVWTIDGKYIEGKENPYDLFMVMAPKPKEEKKTKTYYVNIFQLFFPGQIITGVKVYESKEEAKEAAMNLVEFTYIKTISFEIEELAFEDEKKIKEKGNTFDIKRIRINGKCHDVSKEEVGCKECGD